MTFPLSKWMEKISSFKPEAKEESQNGQNQNKTSSELVNVLGSKEVEQLKKTIEALREENRQLKLENQKLKEENERLKVQNESLKRENSRLMNALSNLWEKYKKEKQDYREVLKQILTELRKINDSRQV